jgi:hypothetical protein
MPKELKLQIYGSYLAEVLRQFIEDHDLRDVVDSDKTYSVKEMLEIIEKKYPDYLQELRLVLDAKKFEMEHELEEALNDTESTNPASDIASSLPSTN